jgi:hypothetical protein
VAQLGDYSGEETPFEEHSFTWFGAEIRANPELSETSYVDFVEEFGLLDGKDPKAALAVKAFMRASIHPDDFGEFWRLAKKHRQTQEQLAKVSNDLLNAITELPTDRSSGSSAGPSRTGQSSTDASFERTIAELEKEGRPDLALVYVEAQQARAS